MIPPATRWLLDSENEYGPGSAAAVPATFQNIACLSVVPLLLLTICVHPEGGVIVGLFPWVLMTATMTSPAAVAEGAVGLAMLSELAPFAPALAAARNAIACPADADVSAV